jgi:hypothetical protein
MAVIIMISLVAMVVMPAVGSFGMGTTRGEARNLDAAVQLAFNMAVVEKTNYRLAFNLDEQCYWAERKEGEVYAASKNQLFSKHCLPDSLSIQSVEALDRKPEKTGMEYIYFTPYGYVEPARIYLGKDDQNGFSIFTDPITGNTVVKEGAVGFQEFYR